MNAADVGAARQGISIIKDPFNQRSMEKFSVYCSTGFMGNWTYHGTVGFKNGNTIGEQKFDAEDLHSLLLKMETFIQELDK